MGKCHLLHYLANIIPSFPCLCCLPSHCKYWSFLFCGMKVCLVYFYFFFLIPTFVFPYSALSSGVSRKSGSIPSWEKRLEASSLSFPGAHSSAVDFGLSHTLCQDCQSDGLLFIYLINCLRHDCLSLQTLSSHSSPGFQLIGHRQS